MREEFLINRQGKQYVLFAGLLDEAHNRGLHGIDTELIQLPTDANNNVAVVKATVEMQDGRTFSGIGDASPDNVGRSIAPHLIRMAETRAKARALRDAVNVGSTALEELSDDADSSPGEPFRARPARPARSAPRPAEPESPPQPAPRPRAVEDNGAAAEPSDQPASDQPARASGVDDDGEAAPSGGGRGGRSQKARKTQVDLLKTLAAEWAGEGGVERLEKRIGKPLTDLTRGEADAWIDRLTPEGRE